MEHMPNILVPIHIVSVIDNSNGYDRETLKRHIAKAVRELIDYREGYHQLTPTFGLVTHDVESKPAGQGTYILNTVDAFEKAINRAPEGFNEFGLPAIDLAIDLSYWRERKRKIILMFFTDEPVNGGQECALQESHVPMLAHKIARIGIAFRGIGPKCRTYEILGKTPRSSYRIVEDSWERREYAESESYIRQFVINSVLQHVFANYQGGLRENDFSYEYNLFQLREEVLPGGLYRELQ